MKKFLCALLAALLLLSLVGCSGGENPGQTEDMVSGQTSQQPEQTTEPEPTAPAITWMTLPDDRVLTAKQYFVYDCDAGAFLTISGPEDERIYPASVTKLFTAYIANLYLRPDQQITVDAAMDYVYPGSSVAELERGDVLTVQMLVEGMLLPSGNDAAYVLALEAAKNMGISQEGVSGVDIFVAEMNYQARLLGMRNTQFANPDGIHEDNHYTTFHDLAIMGMLALRDPVLMRYAGVSTDTVTFANGKTKEWKNTNALLHPDSEYYCPYAVGLKTGQTPSAGSCLLSAFRCNGHTLLVGVFGCPEVEDRFADTLQLFNQVVPELK